MRPVPAAHARPSARFDGAVGNRGGRRVARGCASVHGRLLMRRATVSEIVGLRGAIAVSQ